MAGVTGQAARVVGGDNLRETFRFASVSLMAADAEHRRVEFGRRYRSRIVRVFRQRPVAGLAIHMRVLAGFFLVEDLTMAALAGRVAGEIDWPRADFRHGIAAIMPVFAKTLRNQKSPYDQEQENARDKNPGHSEKMSCIFELTHMTFSAIPKRLRCR